MESQPNTTRIPTEHGIEAWFLELEKIGGTPLEGDVCRSRELVMDIAGKPRFAYTCGCGREALGGVPYQRPDGTTAEVVICAHCDGVSHMPRFEAAVA